MRWTSNMPQDPFPAVGCYPIVTFTTNRTRTLTLTTKDAHGAQDIKSVTINVPNPPLNSPPVVTILYPPKNSALVAPAQLDGAAIDPDKKSPVSMQWRVNQGGTQTLLSSPLSMIVICATIDRQ